MKFRAAVLNEVGAPLTIDTLDDGAAAAARRAGARARQRAVPHRPRGHPGHAAPIRCRSCSATRRAGVVEAIGHGGDEVRPGDHVICSWNPHCGHCFYCERDLPILCETYHAQRAAAAACSTAARA